MSTAATNLFKYGPLKDDLKDHLAMVQREIHRLEASAVAPSGEAALVERFEYKPVILLRERAEVVPEESGGKVRVRLKIPLEGGGVGASVPG